MNIPCSHLTRLSLALNFSLFCYAKQPDRACSIAKSAFDVAIAELKLQGVLLEAFDSANVLVFTSLTRNEDLYKDSRDILQLLRNNWLKWSVEEDEDVGQSESVQVEVQERE